jgi:rRNA maturation endonuclease Nob1
MSQARLLKRVFDIDLEQCPHCGGRLKIIAAVEDPPKNCTLTNNSHD